MGGLEYKDLYFPDLDCLGDITLNNIVQSIITVQ